MNNTTNSWEEKYDAMLLSLENEPSDEVCYERIKDFIRTLLHDTEIAAREEKGFCNDGKHRGTENKCEDWEKEEWGGWKFVSEMLDKPCKNGIYPTSECYRKLYEFVCAQKEQARKEAREEDIAIIDGVIAAYPEDVFIPTTEEWMKEVHEFALSNGHTLDAISADIIRRAAKRIKKDILSSLTKE
jgi:hypothetical protein